MAFIYKKRRERAFECRCALGLMYSDIFMCFKYFWGHYKHKKGHSDL